MIQRADDAFATFIQNMRKSSSLKHHCAPVIPALSEYHNPPAKYAWQRNDAVYEVMAGLAIPTSNAAFLT